MFQTQYCKKDFLKKYSHTLILILLTLYFNGCAVIDLVGSHVAHERQINHKLISNESISIIKGKNIIVIRNNNFVGSMVRYFLEVNGTEIIGLNKSEYLEFSLEAGSYYFSTNCYQGINPEHSNKINIIVKKEQQEPIYILLSPNFSFSSGCSDIEIISSSEGTKLIQNFKKVELPNYK